MKTLKLENTFHNTVVTVRLSGDTLSRAQYVRARRRLCGVSGCTCHHIQAEIAGERVRLVPTLVDGLDSWTVEGVER